MTEKKIVNDKFKATENERKWLLQQWPVVIERHSTLRRFPTLVAGAKEVLRFLYQTEILDYEWYPQNPLDRAKLDTYLQWHDLKKDS